MTETAAPEFSRNCTGELLTQPSTFITPQYLPCVNEAGWWITGSGASSRPALMLASGSLKDTGDNNELPVHNGSRDQLDGFYKVLGFVLVLGGYVLVRELRIFVG